MTIDRSLKYYDLYLQYKNLADVQLRDLPSGFSFVMFNSSQEHIDNWCEIEVSSGYIVDITTAHENFDKYYGEYLDKLKQRCLFTKDKATDRLCNIAYRDPHLLGSQDL